ncbi:MAG: hypothetical protein R8G66_14740 [Cytophagales bacterium]|nr:hypothetical protein [Cytophagales bacterium]
MGIIDIGLISGYILIGLCAVTAIIMPLIQSFSDPKGLAKSAMGVGGLIVVFLIAYGLADPNAEGASESTSKIVGAGLITMYMAVFIAIAGILYTEVSKLIK